MNKKRLALGLLSFLILLAVTLSLRAFIYAPHIEGTLLVQMGEEDDDNEEDSINSDVSVEAEKKMQEADGIVKKYQKKNISKSDFLELKKINSDMHDALSAGGSDGIFWDLWADFEDKDNEIQESLDGGTSIEFEEDAGIPVIKKVQPVIKPVVKPVQKIVQPVKKIAQPAKVPQKISAPSPNPLKPAGKLSTPSPNPLKPASKISAPSPQPYKPAGKTGTTGKSSYKK